MTKFTSYTTGLLVIALMSCDTGNAAEAEAPQWSQAALKVVKALKVKEGDLDVFRTQLTTPVFLEAGGLNMDFPIRNGRDILPPSCFTRVLHMVIAGEDEDKINHVLGLEGVDVNALDSNGIPALGVVLQKLHRVGSLGNGSLLKKRTDKKQEKKFQEIVVRLLNRGANSRMVEEYLGSDKFQGKTEEAEWIMNVLRTVMSSPSGILPLGAYSTLLQIAWLPRFPQDLSECIADICYGEGNIKAYKRLVPGSVHIA